MTQNNNESSLKEEVKAKTHTIRVGENLYVRLENIIKAFKYLENKKYTKKQWITESIIEKLQKEGVLTLETLPKVRRLHFEIDQSLDDKISKNVNITKSFVDSFSKKQWLVEAIFEKLEKDEAIMKESLKEFSEVNH